MTRGHAVDELSDRKRLVSVVPNRIVAGTGVASLLSTPDTASLVLCVSG